MFSVDGVCVGGRMERGVGLRFGNRGLGLEGKKLGGERGERGMGCGG